MSVSGEDSVSSVVVSPGSALAGGDVDRPSRQAERSMLSTEALLDAAVGLVVEGGSAALTFTAIAKRAGFSRGLVTARFGSKQGLVDALIQRVWGRLRDSDAVPMARHGSGLEELLVLVRALRNQARDQPRDMQAMFVLMFEAPGSDAALGPRVVEFHQAMRNDIAAAVARGIKDESIRPSAVPESVAVLLVGALRGISYQWVLEPFSFDLVAGYEALGDHVGRSLTPRS